VEDNPGEITAVGECLRALTFPYHLTLLTDGEPRWPSCSTTRRIGGTHPDLFCGYSSLKTSGWEVLEWLKLLRRGQYPVRCGEHAVAVHEQERDRLQQPVPGETNDTGRYQRLRRTHRKDH